MSWNFFSLRKCHFAIVYAIGAGSILTGCKEPTTIEPAPLRSVKAYVFSADNSGTERRYAAQVRAVVRSSVAFQVSGQVVETNLGVGDRVKKDSVLARLDPKPFLLRVQQAQADLDRTKAALIEADRRLKAQRTLFEKGFGNQQEIDQALSAEVAAKSAVNSAVSALELSQRDLASTNMLAPHSGVIAARTVENYAEIQAGQVIFEIDGDTGIEIVAFIPVSLAAQLKVGQRLNAGSDNNENTFITRITSIGQRSVSADTVPVVVRPLGVVDVSLTPGTYSYLFIPVGSAQSLPVVPIESLLPSAEGRKADVFVIHISQAVERRSVDLGPVTPEGVVVKAGLHAGETIVATGVSFLRDGQQVQVLKMPSR